MKLILTSILLSILIANVYAEPPIYSWRVSDLARSPVENIKLRNEQGHLLKTISAEFISAT